MSVSPPQLARPRHQTHCRVVTVALPIYNEAEVAARVIDAACALEYPAERIDFQVLDDSTDHTRQLIERACANGAKRDQDRASAAWIAT